MDKYDEAVEYLKDHPDNIREAWINPAGEMGGCLFGFVSGSRRTGRVDGQSVGCLTTIVLGIDVAETEGLTVAIRADDRLPDSDLGITVELLPVFAEWQRRIDLELGR